MGVVFEARLEGGSRYPGLSPDAPARLALKVLRPAVQREAAQKNLDPDTFFEQRVAVCSSRPARARTTPSPRTTTALGARNAVCRSCRPRIREGGRLRPGQSARRARAGGGELRTARSYREQELSSKCSESEPTRRATMRAWSLSSKVFSVKPIEKLRRRSWVRGAREAARRTIRGRRPGRGSPPVGVDACPPRRGARALGDRRPSAAPVAPPWRARAGPAAVRSFGCRRSPLGARPGASRSPLDSPALAVLDYGHLPVNANP
jgi:hypothetical protein